MKKVLILFLAVFLLGDSIYSFLQYYYIPLDGDISAGVVPSAHVQQLLDDPLGFHTLSTGEKHVNPNRFFAHLFFMEYMQKVPLWLQYLTDPITSVYLSCALIKIFIHLLFIFILSSLISRTRNILNERFLISASLIAPLIQANGYWGHMGINDKSTTYTFFYALPIVLLMLFMKPLYETVFQQEDQRISPLKSIFLFIPSIILPLSGPLIPGVVLIVAGLIGTNYLLEFINHQDRNWHSALRTIPAKIYIYLIPIGLISLYSLFLGRFDSNYEGEMLPLSDRYLKLPLGIYYQVTQSLGIPVLLIIIGVNLYLIKTKFYGSEGIRIIRTLKWIGIFTAIYLLLLPMGGYRPYRPNILRYDTFLPVTIALLYFYGISSFFLVQNLRLQSRNIYIMGLLMLLAIYINSDQIETEEYRCERQALEYLAQSSQEVTALPNSCHVMSWDFFSDPRRSELNAEILKFWKITSAKRLYYYQEAGDNAFNVCPDIQPK